MSLSEKYQEFMESNKDEMAEDILSDLGFNAPYSDDDLKRAADMINLVTNKNLENIIKTVSKGDEAFEAKLRQDLIEDGVYIPTPESVFKNMTEVVE